jgi:hypothetical protein
MKRWTAALISRAAVHAMVQRVGATKTFTHPVNLGWLAEVSRNARVLHYGRVMAELSEQGFSDLSGVDPSPALIARGRQLRPDLRFAALESPPALPYTSGSSRPA